jgi:transposase
MLAVADRQRGFFDAAWCSELLPDGSIYWLLAEHGDRIVRDEDFVECYSERQGRPSIPPSVLAKVLLLAYRDGLSDERAMEAVRFDLRWKVALDLPIDHPGFHPTSLVRFRARLLLHGKERLVFERSLELATELGLIEGEAEQIVDSTPRLGAAAVQDTATLVRSGVRKLLDAVATAGPENRRSRQSGPPSSSTSTRSQPPCAPMPHNRS